MRVQVGQLPPATDVRCLIQHPDQRHRQPPARGALRELLGGVAQRHRQSGHQPGGAALPLLAVQVQRVARLHERGDCSLQTTRALLSRA
jgi:hypothetical protein